MFVCFIYYQAQAVSLYGRDWNSSLNIDEDAEQVDVPSVVNPLTTSDFSELCQLVDPTSDSDNYGIDQYYAALQLVENKVLHY